ncbi:MAG: acetyl-CoA carboxylase biotin carboxyl carrier protein subunit [Anaerolineae bacterium]|nr:MAG: acetyl-CoA carboxylase biotin carboxyl carrier protein subunit [Anaerolineae bacterium]
MQEGEQVQTGQSLVILEAMKMENDLRAARHRRPRQGQTGRAGRSGPGVGNPPNGHLKFRSCHV